MAGRLTERQRLYLLILALILAQGGGLGVAFVAIVANEAERQRDLCALVAVLTDNPAPPTTERGRQQQAAVERYRQRQC